MSKRLNLVGKRFGKLVVVQLQDTKNQKTRWLCVCDCGKTSVKLGRSLVVGCTKSCGCMAAVVTKHGYASRQKPKMQEYRAWKEMKQRCYNSNREDFCWYGGRGITVCERWLTSFPAFLKDVGMKPNREMSLDRKDVNGNYEPNNCRWATATQQVLNRRPYIRKKRITEWNYLLIPASPAARAQRKHRLKLARIGKTLSQQLSTRVSEAGAAQPVVGL